jgi:cellulose synthase/poly-beta-1,6-N-acetylglucosamine synthase-like glycosyltransferase
MKVSIALTVFNEEETIENTLYSLINQSAKATEIIIVDGGSKDKTVDLIRHLQKKYQYIKLLIQKCSRAEGRNLAVELIRNDIIAMTDAGCIADKDWLKNICSPFLNKKVDISAGFYIMKTDTNFQKATSIFLGVLPSDFNNDFLPSTRSVAFTKDIWEKIGGFDEKLNDCAEDTLFNYKLLLFKARFARVKNALVEWGMPDTITKFYNQIFNYAKGDVKSKIWLYPSKSYMSHNIHSLLIIFRYLFALTLLLISIYLQLSPIFLTIFLLLYFYWTFSKIYRKINSFRAGLWGIILQPVSDFAVIMGFVSGFI